jgi:hypothetical protein
MLEAMRFYHAAGNRDKAAAIAKDAAPYMHPRLTSVDVGGKPGAPIETKDVTNEELARRIAFILGQAAREKGEKTPLAASLPPKLKNSPHPSGVTGHRLGNS